MPNNYNNSPYWYGLRHNSDQPKASGFYDVLGIAIEHAKKRMAIGQSPFWRLPEKQQPMPEMLDKGLFGGGY